MTKNRTLSRNTKIGIALALIAAGAIVTLIIISPVKQVCQQGIKQYGLVALTSISDAPLAHSAAAPVAKEVAARAGDTCASIATGVPGSNPAANLDLHQIALTPSQRTAPDPAPERAEMTTQAETFLQRYFVAPTVATAATAGSPVFGTFAAFSDYRTAEHLGPGCLIFITDGLAIEHWPGGEINLAQFPPPPDIRHRLDAVVPYLRGLGGYDVVILGDGAASPFRTQLLNQANEDIRYVLNQVHAHFDATRSLQLPPRCGE